MIFASFFLALADEATRESFAVLPNLDAELTRLQAAVDLSRGTSAEQGQQTEQKQHMTQHHSWPDSLCWVMPPVTARRMASSNGMFRGCRQERDTYSV